MSADRKRLAVQFGQNLRLCRIRAQISQEELAYLASLHPTAVAMIERGQREPHLGTLVKLAVALSVSLNDLLTGIDWRSDGIGGGGFEFGS